MKKNSFIKKICYTIATVILSVGMLSTIQPIHAENISKKQNGCIIKTFNEKEGDPIEHTSYNVIYKNNDGVRDTTEDQTDSTLYIESEVVTGEADTTLKVLDNTVPKFYRVGYTFVGWNSQADGKGKILNAGDSLSIETTPWTSDVDWEECDACKYYFVYAQWEKETTSVPPVETTPSATPTPTPAVTPVPTPSSTPEVTPVPPTQYTIKYVDCYGNIIKSELVEEGKNGTISSQDGYTWNTPENVQKDMEVTPKEGCEVTTNNPEVPHTGDQTTNIMNILFIVIGLVGITGCGCIMAYQVHKTK